MLSTLVQLQLTGTSCNADQGSPERARDFACHSVGMYAIASQRLQLQLWHCKMPSDGLGYKSLAYGRVLIMDQIRSDYVSPHQADQMFNPQWMGSSYASTH